MEYVHNFISSRFATQYKVCLGKYKISSYCKLEVLNSLYEFNTLCESETMLKFFVADWSDVYKKMEKVHDNTSYGTWFESKHISDEDMYIAMDEHIKNSQIAWDTCLKKTGGDEKLCKEGIFDTLYEFNRKVYPHASISPRNVLLYLQLRK